MARRRWWGGRVGRWGCFRVGLVWFVALFSAFACFFFMGGDCVVASLPTILYTSSSSFRADSLLYFFCVIYYTLLPPSRLLICTLRIYMRARLSLSLLSISLSLSSSSYLPISLSPAYHKYYHQCQCPTTHRLSLSARLPFLSSLITHHITSLTLAASCLTVRSASATTLLARFWDTCWLLTTASLSTSLSSL